MKSFFFALSLFFITTISISQTLRFNEVLSSNGGSLVDSDGDTPDWIELYNAGNTAINLGGYGLSDKKDELFQWVFPEYQMAAGEYLVVLASGKDRKELPYHWNTIISSGDEWKYIVPTAATPTNWRLISYNDISWNTGKSGFGFGDNDDATEIPLSRAVFLRKTFNISNASEVKELLFHLDYDDGFVAYINGVEIARSQMDGRGDFPGYSVLANGLHEALIYQRLAPEAFNIANPSAFLKTGENILAVQVHNASTTSSDLSAIPFLSIATQEKDTNSRTIDLLGLKGNDFHTNFKISADGETLYLSEPSGTLVDTVQVGPLSLDVSYGRTLANSSVWAVFPEPTPGKENTGIDLSAEKPGLVLFSKPAAVYRSGLTLALRAPELTDTIYFTQDGTIPTRSSAIFTKAFDIRTTQVIRARIFKSGMLPGETVTNSYIVYDNKNLPVVSISMDPDDLWNFNTGIYVLGPNAESGNPNFGANFWMDWEKACHFELMENTGEKVVDVDAGVKISGMWSRANAQKSMAFHCRSSYGESFMKHKIFGERTFDEFKDIVLRNSGNDWNISMFRDGLMTGLTLGLRMDQQAFRPSEVFLNGEYWGILNIREKINEEFFANNHHIDPSKVILMENYETVKAGTGEEWLQLFTYIENNSPANTEVYKRITDEIEIESFIDYFASQIFFRNHDWPGNNIRYWKTTDPDSKWRYVLYDTDFGMGIWNTSPTENSLTNATDPNGPEWPNPPWSTLILRRLLENQSFRNQFISRFSDLLNSTFLPDRLNKAIDDKRNMFTKEIANHLSRWGGGNQNSWLNEIQTMKSFATVRPFYMFSHIRSQFGFEDFVSVGATSNPAQGYIQFNSLLLKEFPWHGRYFKEVPITVTAIANAGFRFVKWEGVTSNSNSKTIIISPKANLELKAIFESDGSHYEDVVINEISFNNNGTEDPGDWIELYNKGNFDIDISGWKLTDSDTAHHFLFEANTWLKSKDYMVVSNDVEKLNSVFGPIINELGDFSFGLSNEIDAIRLYSKNDLLIDEVDYTNSAPWKSEDYTKLWSLELNSPAYDNNSGINWQLSVGSGTPGQRNSAFIPANAEEFPAIQEISELFQNYPNPFTEGTSIEVKLAKPCSYLITIMDVSGKIVRRLSNENQLSTVHTIYWDGKDNSGKSVFSGVYIYKLECDGFSEIKRMIKI